MEKLTCLEKQALEAMTKDDFYENGLDSVLWTDVYLDTLKGYYKIGAKQARGVISSLIKKGIFKPIYFTGRDSTVSLTDFGKTVMKELGFNK